MKLICWESVMHHFLIFILNFMSITWYRFILKSEWLHYFSFDNVFIIFICIILITTRQIIFQTFWVTEFPLFKFSLFERVSEIRRQISSLYKIYHFIKLTIPLLSLTMWKSLQNRQSRFVSNKKYNIVIVAWKEVSTIIFFL